MKKFLLAVLFLGLGGALVACPPRAVYRPYVAPYVAPAVVVTPYVPVAVFTPVAVAVPAYGATYVPPAAGVLPAAPPPMPGAAPNGNGANGNGLEAILKKLDERLARLEGNGPAPLNKGAAPKGDAVAMLTAKCASCHTGPKSEGNFQMFDDKGVLVPTLNKGKVYRECHKGSMPRGPDKKTPQPLSDAEVESLLEWLGQ